METSVAELAVAGEVFTLAVAVGGDEVDLDAVEVLDVVVAGEEVEVALGVVEVLRLVVTDAEMGAELGGLCVLGSGRVELLDTCEAVESAADEEDELEDGIVEVLAICALAGDIDGAGDARVDVLDTAMLEGVGVTVVDSIVPVMGA
ncbi:hypothetical protein LTR66_011300 [Elasticomyces elasticus]|nr:hypothetical protein LTR66_011300 [Elasticomyces elasticus]KAK4978349.1 hypothetical protein LTR28_006042 [Elasticomyces elasticus]